jgi:subtilisin family serine protease
MPRRLPLSLLLALGVALPAPALAAEGDVIVRYRAAADASERADTRRDADVVREAGLPLANTELVDPEAGVSAARAAAELSRDPDVLYAEADVPRRALAVPSDRLFRAQWGLENVGQTVGGASGTADADIDAPEAWDLTTGSPGVIVAVIDSGVDILHPDLAPNVFRNVRETAGNGVDDDRNGFVDDVNGWDFVAGDAAPLDENGHGTHVAGTAAARGNDGIGVTGVAWQAGILPLRTLGADGTGSASDAIRAYAYAARSGARVVNLSLGGPSGSRAERDAIASASRVLFVAAAGNDGEDNDAVGSYPCEYELPNVLCVAASDRSDGLASFSNFGAASVDLAAPGVAIASTWLNREHVLLDGTSMATPMVTGAAALLFSSEPAATVADVRSALLSGVDPVPALAGRTVTGGRLNAAKAVAAIAGLPAPAEGPSGSARQAVPEEPTASPDGTSSGGATMMPPVEDPPGPAPPEPMVIATPAMLPDRSAPLVTLRFTRAPSTVSALVRSGARLALRCSEGCALTVQLRRGTRTLVTRRVAATAGATTSVTLRPARRALRPGRRVTLTLRVVAADPAGNRRTVSRRITLRG